MILHCLEVRPNFIVNEVASGIADHPLLFREILGRKYLRGAAVFDQKCAAFDIVSFHLCVHINSNGLRLLASTYEACWDTDKRFPSGSLNHATFVPSGAVQIPSSSCFIHGNSYLSKL